MKVWVYVEGQSDVLALNVLWGAWNTRLKPRGVGIAVISLDNKAQLLRKIGPRAAEKLCHNEEDIVVGLPDLHPIEPFRGTNYAHDDWLSLATVQRNLVAKELKEKYCITQMEPYMKRFFGSTLKHDLEILLLAAVDSLRAVLETKESLGGWQHPVENQNLNRPPKRVVEDLFLHRSRRKLEYRDTKDAAKVLGKVANDIGSILWNKSGQLECPVFKDVLDWMGDRTSVKVY